METFFSNDSCESAEFWDSRYRAGEAAWETTRMPGQLARWIAEHPAGGGTVLIPGCGSGREISAFAVAGWNVTAIDFSPAAIALAHRNLGGASARLILNDFFAHPFAAGTFDVIYERTFLTAIPPARWPACAERYGALLKPGGSVVGYGYYGFEEDPPPFLQAPDQPPVFAHGFVMAEDAPSPDAIPFLAGKERWQVWVRR
jgi:protein-L-isoaspartate O-methyltransferase